MKHDTNSFTSERRLQRLKMFQIVNGSIRKKSYEAKNIKQFIIGSLLLGPGTTTVHKKGDLSFQIYFFS